MRLPIKIEVYLIQAGIVIWKVNVPNRVRLIVRPRYFHTWVIESTFQKHEYGAFYLSLLSNLEIFNWAGFYSVENLSLVLLLKIVYLYFQLVVSNYFWNRTLFLIFLFIYLHIYFFIFLVFNIISFYEVYLRYSNFIILLLLNVFAE